MLGVGGKRGRTGRHRKSTRKVGQNGKPVSCAHQAEIVELHKWMTIHTFGKCSLVPYIFPETGRGLMTTKDVLPNDLILAIPKYLLITTEIVLNSDIGHWIKRWQPKLCPQQVLSVFLMWETWKGSASEWYPYMKVLPLTFTSSAYFTESELRLLPKSVYQKAVKSTCNLKKNFQQIVDFSLEHWPISVGIFTYETFRHAWCAVNSRSVYMEVDKSEFISGEENNLALAPFLDLLNHSTTAQTNAGYNKETECYEIRTAKPYKKHEQVFISYGPADNHRLMHEYGFILPNNPHDVYEFTFDDLESLQKIFNIDFWPKKAEILRQHKMTMNLSCSEDGLSWKLTTALHILAMDWTELQNWRSAMHTEKISAENEKLTKMFGRHLITSALSEQDAIFNLVSDADTLLTFHQEMAVELQRIDRKILQKSMNSLQ